MIKKITLIIVTCLTVQVYAQEWARVTIGGKLEDNQWTGSFDLDINRTEAKDENTYDGSISIGGGNSSIYFKPGASISFGGDSSAVSSDDLLGQIQFLYIFKNWNGQTVPKGTRFLTKNSHYLSFELNPSINSDKNFNERLYYIQPKYANYTFIREKYPRTINTKGLISIFTFHTFAYSYFGARNSRDFKSLEFYSTSGAYGKTKLQLKKWKAGNRRGIADISIEGEGMYVISEAKHFNSINPLRFKFKAGIDFYLFSNFSIGAEFKSGDISPDYQRYSSYGISLKFKK